MGENPTSLTAGGTWRGKLQEFEDFTADPGSVDMLVQRVAEGETLKEICRSRNLPYSKVAQWICENEGVLRRYEAALALWADALAQESVALAAAATPETVNVAKLRIATHLKLAGKWDRERYGERLKVEGAVRVPVDAGLMGLAGELLARIAARSAERSAQGMQGRTIDAERPEIPASGHEFGHELI